MVEKTNIVCTGLMTGYDLQELFICVWDIAQARLYALDVAHRSSQPFTSVVVHRRSRPLAFLVVKRRGANGASGRLARLL